MRAIIYIAVSLNFKKYFVHCFLKDNMNSAVLNSNR